MPGMEGAPYNFAQTKKYPTTWLRSSFQAIAVNVVDMSGFHVIKIRSRACVPGARALIGTDLVKAIT